MAEIILPPEEETPQVPELNIDKPTENSKVITIEFEAKKTNKVSTKDTNQQLYTTDTDAWFEFKETSLEGANGTYSVVFRNRHGGSIFQRTGDVVNGVAYYKIPHQEIRHAGAWRGQLVYTLENGNTTAREFGYDVKGHILDGKDVREIVVEDFETLMSQLRSMKDNAEVELADLVNTAERNELERQQFYESLVEDINDLQENYQELLDIGVLQTNINEKLEELEEEYAPRLTEVTTQLAQTDFVAQVSRLIGGYDKMYYKKENTLNWITVMIRNKSEHVSWTFRNNTADDFIILGDCFYGDLTESQSLTESKNYDSNTGTWNTATINHYTTQIGATMTATFKGERLDFNHYANNQGGVWRFVIDGDTENPINISTYSLSAISKKTDTVITGLSNTEHTVVATFMGDDPNNPPSSGSARGWVSAGSISPKSFDIYSIQLTNNRVQELLVSFSNKEFAFRVKKANTSHSSQFVPMHSGIGTAFKKREPQFIADDTIIDYQNLPLREFVECNSFSLVQSVYGRNPESADENLMEINTNVSINKSGNVEITGKMQPLTEIDVENGYGIMFPVKKDITTKAISSKGNEHPTIKTDYSSTFMPEESDTTTSFAFVSEENPDFIASIRFNDIRNTLRAGINKGATPLWIEHRDSTMQKLYYRPFYNAKLTPNDEFKFSATFNCGKVQRIYDII